MKELPANLVHLPLHERAFMVLKEAVREALEEHAREGRPDYVVRDGEPVALSPDEIRAILAEQEDESNRNGAPPE